MASPTTPHATTPAELIAARTRIDEIREMAISRGNMMNDGAYRTSSRAGSLAKEILGWVEELSTLAEIDHSADDLFDRLTVFTLMLGLGEMRRRARQRKESRAERAKRREQHRELAETIDWLVWKMSAKAVVR